jgi:hypothetical protein
MILLLTDENFNHRILRGLLRDDIELEIDIIRIQDTEVYQADDPTILEWAADEGRVVITHDVNTMTKHAYDRIKDGKTMLGLIIVPKNLDIGDAIAEIKFLIGATEPEEFENQVIYLPL